MMAPRSRQPARRGLSLLEVLVALAIFLFAFAILGQLIIFGSDRALDAQYQGQAAQLCQAKMAEVLAGAVPLQSQAEAPFEEDPDWRWSLECATSEFPGLWNVTVSVSRQRPQGSHVTSSLSQMVLDPGLRGNVQDTPADVSAGGDPPGAGSS